MKVSFITTVLNEEKTIQAFLESVFNQSQKPDEIIIVDGGSTDGTVGKIKSLPRRQAGEKLKILIKPGNRAVGRNEAIRKATSEIITVSDVGCILDKDWLKNITQPLKDDPEVEVVAGYYRPVTKSIFEKCLATYTCVMPDKINPANFLPSSRSVAFKKSAWEKVGGYPENLNTCEDLIFAQKMKKVGSKFKFAPEAIVFWRQKSSWGAAFWQLFGYAVGDGQSLLSPYSVHRKKIIFLFSRYLLGIFLIILSFKWQILLSTFYFLFSIYLLWAFLKNYRYVRVWQAILILPLFQLTADLAVILGTTVGFFKSLKSGKIQRP